MKHEGDNPGMKVLAERGVVTASLVLACVLFVSMVAAPSVIADGTSSGVATAGLIIASAMGGWCYGGRNDRSAAIGVAVGMPLGFFYFQNSYARSAGIVGGLVPDHGDLRRGRRGGRCRRLAGAPLRFIGLEVVSLIQRAVLLDELAPVPAVVLHVVDDLVESTSVEYPVEGHFAVESIRR